MPLYLFDSCLPPEWDNEGIDGNMMVVSAQFRGLQPQLFPHSPYYISNWSTVDMISVSTLSYQKRGEKIAAIDGLISISRCSIDHRFVHRKILSYGLNF